MVPVAIDKRGIIMNTRNNKTIFDTSGNRRDIQPQVEFIQLKTIELFYSYNLWLNRPRVLLLQNNFHYAGHTFNPRLNKSMFSSYKQWQNDT